MRAATHLAALPLVAWSAVAACGGGGVSAKPAMAPPDPPPTRRIIEDSSEEDSDELEVVSKRGRMEVADIEAGIAVQAGALEACFTGRVGRRRWLGGKVSITWTISRTGEITSVTVPESDLGAWEVEKCLLAVARATTFASPHGGGTDFSLPFEFTGKGSAVWWDEDIGEKAVGKRTEELGQCRKAGATTPRAEVMITIYVGTRGKVQSAGFASAKPIPDDWGDCAARIIAGWTLPDPRGKIAKLGLRYRVR